MPAIAALGGVYWRLGGITAAVKSLSDKVQHDGEERQRIWNRIDDHEKRLVRVEVKQEVTE